MTPEQNIPGSNGNEEVVPIAQSPITGASLSGGLGSYPRHLLVGAFYPSAEMLSVSFISLVDWPGERDDHVHLFYICSRPNTKKKVCGFFFKAIVCGEYRFGLETSVGTITLDDENLLYLIFDLYLIPCEFSPPVLICSFPLRFN